MTKNRQLLLVLLAVVALLAIYENPTGTGGVVRNLLDALLDVVASVFDFAGAVVR